MKKLLARLVRQSPAMIVAMLALFVALTGTAVATTSVLITGKQIKNGSITGLDIKNKSVTAADVKGQLRGARGLPGSVGPQGPAGGVGAQGLKGDKGDKGDQGDKGLTGPTAGVVAAVGFDDTHNPRPTFTSLYTRTVTLPEAGAMFVFGHLDTSLGCMASGACDAVYGLYVDNTPVPGSGRPIKAGASSSSAATLSMTGVLQNVAAGTHTLRIGYAISPHTSSLSWRDRSVGGILLGGALATASAGSSPLRGLTLGH